MQPNPILEEVWKTKDRLAAEASYDVDLFFEQLRTWQAANAPLLAKAKREERAAEALTLREEPPKAE
jgi:hypothetical protein